MKKSLVLILIVVLYACSGGKKLMNKNLAYIYYNDPTIIHPEYVIHHQNDSISKLYFKINSKEALYSKKLKDSIYSAELSLNYKLFRIENPKEIIDSATIHLVDSKNKSQQRYLSGEIKFHADTGKKYFLIVTIYDKIRDQQVQNYQIVDKKNFLGRQNFLIKDDMSKVLFSEYLHNDQKVVVKCNKFAKNKEIFVRYYNRKFDLPAPPFSITDEELLNYSADSIFKVQQQPDSTFSVTLPKNGLYHFQADTSTREGLTLFQFFGSFPNVKQPEDMLDPIQYLTTRQEFKNLETNGANKETIDDFWFRVAGNQERGRAIIKEFYNRVQEANHFFSSYLEGWKTDRGMIYVIYGPPNVIYKTLDSENWIYGEQNNVLSVNFTFYKVDNPFTNNDFYLSRSPVYRSSWYRAVDSWRQGKVY